MFYGGVRSDSFVAHPESSVVVGGPCESFVVATTRNRKNRMVVHITRNLFKVWVVVYGCWELEDGYGDSC